MPANPRSSRGPARHGALAAALTFFLSSSALGAPPQDYESGRAAYINGEYKRALEILQPLAAEGNSEAQKLLGVMYDYGHGVKADPKRALDWYIKSAEQGDPAVQYQVGAKYFRGDGTERNYLEAAKWWELAANGGQIDAQFNLGLMFFRGLAVRRDDARAAELFRLAAAQGHSHAQYSLAVMYAFGRGVDQNYTTALDWFNKSAAQGVAQAQYNLGVFHENAFGVNRDLAVARKWYERAAAQGLAEARDKLAAMDASSGAASVLSHPAEALAVTEPTPASPPPGPAPALSTRVYPKLPPAAEVAASSVTPALEAETPAAASGVAQAGGPKREKWVLGQQPDHYTLQIGSVTSESDIRKFLGGAGIEAEAAYIQVEIDGVTRYNALYGVYENYAAATAAAESLPAKLRGVKPWVRNFGVLQKMLQ